MELDDGVYEQVRRFTDATVRGAALLITAGEHGKELWSLGIGVPDQPDVARDAERNRDRRGRLHDH